MSIKSAIWDVTTAIVADTIALFSPGKAAQYRTARNLYKRSYTAATNKGAYQLHRPTNCSGNAEVLSGRERATARVRDMERNNPLVAGMVRKRTTMVIGDEIGIKPQIVDASGVPLEVLNRDIENRFYQWADNATVNGLSLTEAYWQIMNHLTIDGEIMRRDTSVDGEYKIQILETDYLVPSFDVYGIEYDAVGKPVKYTIYDHHPSDVMVNYKASSFWKYIELPASQISFLAETVRSSQHRGISPLISALQKLYGVDDLEDAELIAARSSAAFGVIIKLNDPANANYSPYAPDGDETNSPTDANNNKREYLESGGIMRLDKYEEATSFKSERPNSNFDPFIRGRHRSAAGAIGISYETATGDFSQVNYSSARMGKLIEWANVRRMQYLIKRDLNKLYRKWFRLQVGKPGFPVDPASYLSNPEKYHAVSWQLAGNDGIDPVKEINTLESEIALGVNSRARYCAEHGRDLLEVTKDLSAEKTLLKELSLYQEDPIVAATVATNKIDPVAPVSEATLGDANE